MSGRNGVFGYGLSHSEGVPDRVSIFTPFSSETLKMDRPPEANPNLDPSGFATKGENLRALGGGDVMGAADSESWLTMRAHQHGYYEHTTPEAGVELWVFRAFDASTDTAIAHYLRSLWFRIWRDQQTNPREYTGIEARVNEFELSVDAHKFAMFKHSMIFLRDTYMGKPVEVAVNAAYTGDWERRGHRRSGDELGADLYFEVSTAGALGVAKIKMGTRVSFLTLTSAGTVATGTTIAPHGLATGQLITNTGATPVEYNVVATAITVTSPTTFTFPIVDAGDVPATGTVVGKVLHATEYLIVNDWMEFMTTAGTRKGTRREPVQIRPVMQTGDVFTLADSWRVPALAPAPVSVITDRQRLTGTDMTLSFSIGGVVKSVVIAQSFSLKYVTPLEAKEGLGSKYLRSIGEPTDAQHYVEVSFPRTYVDADFEQALVSDSTISVTATLWGTAIGVTGEEDFAKYEIPNMTISAAGATISNAGDLPETVMLRSYPIEGTPVFTETYQNTVATITPT